MPSHFFIDDISVILTLQKTISARLYLNNGVNVMFFHSEIFFILENIFSITVKLNSDDYIFI